MRERWPVEKDYIRTSVIKTCREAGYDKAGAERQAEKVLRLLGDMTPQPVSAARFLLMRAAEEARARQ